MTSKIEANSGSFRDPVNRVYELNDKSSKRILRGLSSDALDIYNSLSETAFFKKFIQSGKIISTSLLPATDRHAQMVIADGWYGVLEHETVPFISYPYEWTFSMLKDAALLQLELIETSLENGWILKDATPYNIQFIGSRAVFIDVPSFEPWVKGEPWIGYRQFCAMFLTPLMLKSHLGIDHVPLMRSYLDGVPPTEAIKYFQGMKRFKKGVMSHVVFPAKVENSIANKERDAAPAYERKARQQSHAMVVGLVQSLRRLIKKLSIKIDHTNWSQYDKTHSYKDIDFQAKKDFVLRQASLSKRDQVWDIGCNTGTFSGISAEFCNQVISMDGDHNAVEQLYLDERKNDHSNILPLVMNLANVSPSQGWASKERLALEQRKKPDLVLCLAVIHHMRITANIPNKLFLEWLHELNAEIIIEFVNRDDEMVIKLLTNKKEKYEDYNIDQFVKETEELFTIKDRKPLKGGKRELFFLQPR